MFSHERSLTWISVLVSVVGGVSSVGTRGERLYYLLSLNLHVWDLCGARA